MIGSDWIGSYVAGEQHRQNIDLKKKTIVFEPNYPLCAILDEKLRCCTTYTETKTKAIRRRRKSSIW